MRQAHFEAFRPVCPACLRRGLESDLRLDAGAQEDARGVHAGVLRCTAPDCGQAYPILDGAPILVPDLGAWLASNGHLLLQRHALPDPVEDLIAAALGPDAAYNVIRHQQASYAHDHYGDLSAGGTEGAPSVGMGAEPGAVRRCLATALARLPAPQGPVLDIGCAVGRTSFDLAAATGGPVLGMDLNWPLLAIGRGVIDRGEVAYPHRRLGQHYERRWLAVALPGAERVDFWVADALALPFRGASIAATVAMNVLDCVSDPARLLWEMTRVLAAGGGAAVVTPFDWAAHATPPAAWIDGPRALNALLAQVNAGTERAGLGALRLTGPGVEVDWQVRLHDRASMHYAAHLLTAVHS